jgi:hypothetical protein
MKINMQWIFALIGLLFLSACPTPKVFKKFDDTAVNHHLIVLGKYEGTTTAMGFSGAIPANARVSLTINDKKVSDTSKADGSFSLAIPTKETADAKTGVLQFDIPAQAITSTYEIRDLVESINKVVGNPIMTGGNTTDFILSKAGGKNLLVVTATHSSSLTGYKLNSLWSGLNDAQFDILLNPELAKTPAVNTVAELAQYYVVSLFANNELVLIDKAKGTLLHTTKLMKPSGELAVLPLNETLTTQMGIDVLNDGKLSTNFSQSYAFGPEAILPVSDDKFLVSFVNYFQMAEGPLGKAVVGPGVIALLQVKDNKIATLKILETTMKNPNVFFGLEKNSVWVSCSGVWESKDGKMASHKAGLIKLAFNTSLTDVTEASKIDMTDFAPAKPVLVRGKIVVPESYGGRVVVFEETAKALSDGKMWPALLDKNYKFSFATHWQDDLVFLGEASGNLVSFDLNAGFWAFPFVKPILLTKNEDATVVFAPQKLVFRSGRLGVDYQGNNALTFLPHQGKWLPLDFLEIFGP